MLFARCRSALLVGWLSTMIVGGCQKEGTTAAPRGKDGSTGKPVSVPVTPSVSAPSSAETEPHSTEGTTGENRSASGDDVLKLTGVTMRRPEGWGSVTVSKGQFASKTIIRLPKVAGDAEDATVEMTHFPGMKGKDDLNINRWLATVTRSDGSPHTRETAKLKIIEQGHVRLTVLDLSGTVKTSMFGSGGGSPDHRMIAAIVDHPKGPHFVKVVGPAATMEKWADSIDAFLRSANADGGS